MIKRQLGHSDLSVAPLVFGGNVFGWTIDQPTSFRLLDEFVASGLNMIDTADMYSVWHPGNKGGESETIIGNWLKQSKKRDQVLIATKVGMDSTPSHGSKGLTQKIIFQGIEDSLRRLQVDYIDLYQAHIDDPNTPQEETLNAFTQLIKQGKVRAIGASNYSADRLAKAIQISEQNKLARFESLQPEYNLYDRSLYEGPLEELCTAKDIGVITYFSLARGFLSGKYVSEADLHKSLRGSSIKQYLNDRGFRIIESLNKVAKEYKSNPTQVALAWLIARPNITAPIVSATTTSQMQDLIKATQLILDKSAIDCLNQASEYSLASKH